MKNFRINTFLLVVLLVAGVTYGLIIHKYQVFPYKFLQIAYQKAREYDKSYGPWSIGIYEGSTLFDLDDPEDISNPVLTGKDVDDIDARFVADPFMIVKNDTYFMFFEVLNRKSSQGDIAYAESRNGKEWNYKKVVIDEKFHLSYPYVFEWDSSYYLIPESSEDFSVRLYKATNFPEEWEYVENILYGYRYTDPTVFHYKDMWWMFVSNVKHNVLNLYYSKTLSKDWQPHPKNPIRKEDKNFSRPAGRVLKHNHKLFRLAQDDDSTYGNQVFAFEITELSDTSYTEKFSQEKPIVTKTGTGWNAAGMHHVDLHKTGNKWMGAVDGRKF